MRKTSRANNTKIRVLLLSSQPGEASSRLRLDERFRQVVNQIRQSPSKKQLDLRCEWAMQSSDVQQALLKHRPHIVHFIGGGRFRGIALEDDSGSVRPLSPQALAGTLRLLKGDIRIVILDSCYSKVQAAAISREVDFTIGMKSALAETARVDFTTHFYNALAFGRSVLTSFELASSQLEFIAVKESSSPLLLVRVGAQASEAILEPIDSAAIRDGSLDYEILNSNTVGSVGDRSGIVRIAGLGGDEDTDD